MTITSAPSEAAAIARREQRVRFTPVQYWACVLVLVVSIAGAIVAFVMVSGKQIGVCPQVTQPYQPGNSNCYPNTFIESRLK